MWPTWRCYTCSASDFHNFKDPKDVFGGGQESMFLLGENKLEDTAWNHMSNFSSSKVEAVKLKLKLKLSSDRNCHLKSNQIIYIGNLE